MNNTPVSNAWKTYQHSLGFTVHYPSSWTLDDASWMLSFTPENARDAKWVMTVEEVEDPETYMNELTTSRSYPGVSNYRITTKPVRIGTLHATQVVQQNNEHTHVIILFTKDSYVFTITHYFATPQEDADFHKFCESITFKN